MPQSASSRGRGLDDGYGPWVPKGKKNDPVREAEQRRRDGIDAEKRRERREKEREEAEKRNPKNNEPRVIGDPRGLWSEPPRDRGLSYTGTHSLSYAGTHSYPPWDNRYNNASLTSNAYSGTHSNPYNNPLSGSENNPYNSARSSSNSPHSRPALERYLASSPCDDPYNTPYASHSGPRYGENDEKLGNKDQYHAHRDDKPG